MKIPSHPAPRPPLPPQNRARARVTPALTPSRPPSVLASRTSPMSAPALLPSTAVARRTMRRHRGSNPTPWWPEGSQGSGSSPQVSEVAAGNPNPAWRSTALPPCCVTRGSWRTKLPPGVWSSWGVCHSQFLLTENICPLQTPPPGQGMTSSAGVVALGVKEFFQSQARSLL